MHLGFGEIVVVGLLALLLFGSKRVTDLGPALGKSLRGFKQALAGEDEPKPAAAPAPAPQQPNGGQPPTTPTA